MTIYLRLAAILSLAAHMACVATHPPGNQNGPADHPRVGLLVMAHGGTAGWNQDVVDAVEPFGARLPTALAFGMADPTTLASGLDSLAARGVQRVALVRVFVSGTSFLQRTAQLLRLPLDVPKPNEAVSRLEHGLDIATHMDGLADWAGIGTLVAQRATEVSDDPRRESVLILAHGQGADDENDRLLQTMEHVVQAVRDAGFHEVRAVTLREDWPDARQRAEHRARKFVTERAATGDRVIVVPFRLSGFGPYADVLTGLPYLAASSFLPHPGITLWIEQTAAKIICINGWATETYQCESEFALPKVGR